MDKALAYMEEFRRKTGRRITVTHLMTKAVGEALRRCPEANAILRFNKIHLRKKVVLSVLVVQPDEDGGKVDLTAARIEDADQKSLVQIADELDKVIRDVRARKDKALEKGKTVVQRVPFMFMNLFLKLLSFFMYTLNLDLSVAGDAARCLRRRYRSPTWGPWAWTPPTCRWSRTPGCRSSSPPGQMQGRAGGRGREGGAGQGDERERVVRSPVHRRLPRRDALEDPAHEFLENPFERFDDFSKLTPRTPTGWSWRRRPSPRAPAARGNSGRSPRP